MKKPALLVLAAFALSLLSLSTPARAQNYAPPVPPEGIEGARRVSTERIAPRLFRFSDLPQAQNLENAPITLRREHEWAEATIEVKRLKANPPFLPATSFAQFTEDTTPAAANSKGGFSAFAPTITTGFEGITQGGFIPGEPTIGAGPLNIFTAGNVAVTVTNKDGTNRVQTTGATFFNVPVAEGAISDAQCYYDALRGRFVALCFTQGTAPSNFSNFYLAISQTNDARGTWFMYKFDMTKDGAVQTSNWGDYQGLGISDDKIVFSSQQFTFATNAYVYQKLRVIDRAAAYSGGVLSFVDIVNFAAPPGGDTNDNFVTKPARNLTLGENTIHLLCVRTGSGARVTYRTLTGPPATANLATVNTVSVSAYSAPPDAPQLGAVALVATNDCRPTDFYWRNGVLIASWHTAATISATNVSAIRLFRMRTSDRAVLTDETFGQASTFYYYPAVTVDSVGTIFLGFGRSSSTEFPSSYVSGKRRSDGAIQASALAKAGLSATAQTRWGDYTGIDQDASAFSPGSTTAWYIGQWTKATNTFGTWASKLTFTYGQVFGTVTDDCDGLIGTTGDRAAIAGISVALKQGATTVATTTTNTLGQYSFGYLESGTYDVVVTAPASGTNVDAINGTGATTQTRINAADLQIVLTNAQSSSGNNFVVASSKPVPVTTLINPANRSVGDPAFLITVTGSNFSTCSVVRLDGLDRVTTFVSATQLTANILAPDQGAGGTKTITVFTPTPGGGTSNGQTLTISGTPDITPPVVSITAPNGGESWGAGTVQNITWTATDNVAVTTVNLALSTDGGGTFPTAIATGIANSGTFAWTVPFPLTSTARVRVTAFDGSGNSASAASAANFSITGFTVTASAGPNGTIAPNGVTAYAGGATPSFTITPNTGYSVLDVLVNAVSVGAVTNYTFAPLAANQTISATFVINTYTLTVATVGNGSVAKAPNQVTYNHGTVVQLTATPDPNWNFDFWSGDASGNTNPLSVTMDANKSITANFGQHLYTWIPTGTSAWTTSTNWSPTRTAPATDDVLMFNNGAANAIVTGIPVQTVGQIIVSSNTNVQFQAAAAVTLTVGGVATGTDLSVAAGSTLQLTGASAVTLNIGTGATGSVSGTANVAGAAHRFTATDNGSLVFASGATMTTGNSFSGSPFGTTALNSVVFQTGSLYQHVSGANPFGATAPSSVVTFQAGSRYRLDGPLTPSMTGRTYADFEYNNAAAVSPTGGTAVTLDSLVVSQGTLNLNLTGGAVIRGAIHVKPAGTLTFTPASGTPTFSLAGSAAQEIDVQGTFTPSSGSVLNINNAAGVNLITNQTLAGNLSFTSGTLNTGARTLTLGTGASVVGAAQGTGWVNGNLAKTYVAGVFVNTLAIGDAATYAPVAISGTGAGAGFSLTARTTGSEHPNFATSGLDATRSVNRFWSVTPANAAGATWSATYNFATSDLDGTADPLTFQSRAWNGAAWSTLPVNATTSNSAQLTGLNSATPTQYAFGNLPTFTITASAGANGSIAPSGAVSVVSGGNQGFTITPNAGFNVLDVLVDGVSVGAVTTFTFTNVTSNHTIAASFVGSAQSLNLTIVGGGVVNKNPNLVTYPFNSSVQLTAVPSLGWAFSAYSGDLVSVNAVENLLMNGTKNVTATFLDTAAPTVAVTAPNGAEVLNIGTNSAITWSATDNAAVTAVDVELSRAGIGGPFETIATSLANSGTYSWLVTGPVTANARVRVTARDAASNSASDLSNADFSIADGTAVDNGPVVDFGLSSIVPNPVRRATRFTFALPREANIRLSVHDVQGRERLLLANGGFGPGRHTIDWTRQGSTSLDPGLYFVRLQVPGRTITRRFVLMQ